MKTVTIALAAAALLSLGACGKTADNAAVANDVVLNDADTIPADDNFTAVDNAALTTDNALDNAADAAGNAVDAAGNAADNAL